MKHFRIVQMANGVIIEPARPLPPLEKIPAGIYRVGYDPETRSIQLVDMGTKFNVPSKIYGKHAVYKNMILRALNTRDESVGVLLLGMKGAGKTILAHDLCNTAVSVGHPVFVIENALPAALLKDLAKIVGGECVFLFDEFCVTYNKEEERADLLTFFSNREVQKALYLVMQNEENKLPEPFLNRTGRFLFRLNYSCLTRPEAAEIIQDFILDPERVTILLDYVDQVPMTPDTLISLLRQIESFGPSVDLDTLFQVLNIPRPTFVNVDFEIGVDPETPLPEGSEIQIERRNREDYNVTLRFKDGSRFVGSRVEVKPPLVGRGGELFTHETWSGGMLNSEIRVTVGIKTSAVATVEQYHAPTLAMVPWVPKKKRNDN